MGGLEQAEGQRGGAGDDGRAAQVDELLGSRDPGHRTPGRLDDGSLIAGRGDVEDAGHRAAEPGDARRCRRIAQHRETDAAMPEVDEMGDGGVDAAGGVEVDARDPVVVAGIGDPDERQPACGEHPGQLPGRSPADDDGTGDRGPAVLGAEERLGQDRIALGDGFDVDDGDAQTEHPVRQDLRQPRIRVDVAGRHGGFDQRDHRRPASVLRRRRLPGPAGARAVAGGAEDGQGLLHLRPGRR